MPLFYVLGQLLNIYLYIYDNSQVFGLVDYSVFNSLSLTIHFQYEIILDKLIKVYNA